jgi:hypothetical protein
MSQIIIHHVGRAKEPQRLSRLILSARDFQEAISAATFLLEEVRHEESISLAESRRLLCYETTMVVAYARPFSASRGVVRPFQWKHVDISLSAPELTLHRKLIAHRNTVFAHSDAEFKTDYSAYLIETSVQETADNFKILVPAFREGLVLSFDEVESALELARKGLHAAHRKANEIALSLGSSHFS